jgi:nucleoside 2-deoxyribosyltransferase
MSKKVYYLASPYSHPQKKVMQERYIEQGRIASILIRKGYHLVTPIEMCHNISKRYIFPTGYRFWERRDRALIQHCDGIIICLMPGWEDSIGVTDELRYSRKLKKSVRFFDPEQEKFVSLKKAVRGTKYDTETN